jgi:hypothetical protein
MKDHEGGMTSTTGLCPNCRALRNAHVVAEHEEILQPTEPDPTAYANAYRILKCAGCDTVYFQREKLEIIDNDPYFFMDEESREVPAGSFTEFKELLHELRDKADHVERGDYDCNEETIYWPTPAVTKLERPDWRKLRDEVLIKLLNSVYTALEYDLRVLAAIGMRVVFERASELVGVDPDKTFAKKLDQLTNDGHIGVADKQTLEVLTDAGGAAAHRGWEPDLEQLSTLVSIMEHFVKRFILSEEAEKLKDSIPPRKNQRKPNSGQLAQLIEFPPPKPSKNSG